MFEAYAKLALNFYFFLLGDEALAITGASLTMKKCKKFKKTGLNQVDFLKILISDYEKIKSKIKNKNKNLIGAHQLTKSQWSQVDPAKLIKWKHFIKNADSQLEVVLALRYLLNVPNDIISQAMDVPKGTVLYRIGRGLEQLSIK